MDAEVRQANSSSVSVVTPAIKEIWSSYFSDDFSAENSKTLLINELVQSLQLPAGLLILEQVAVKSNIHVLPVDHGSFRDLCAMSSWESILETSPSEALTCLEVAAHVILGFDQSVSQVNVRLQHYHEAKLDLRDLKASSLDKLVTVSGTVVRVSIVKPLVKAVELTCTKCGSHFVQNLVDGRYAQPRICGIEGCRNRTYILNKETADKVDFQKIRLQEISTGTGRQEGRVPRTVECELKEDLVDSCMPGDLVTICGFVKYINKEMDIGGGHGKNKNNLYDLYIDVNSVVNKCDATRNGRGTGNGVPNNVYHFSTPDLERILDFVETQGPNLFKHLVHSICPSIYGHELVKAGIVLSLFGGVGKHLTNPEKVPVRGDIHVLIVGDPGLGKSQLLKAAANRAPRGIYICGNAASTAGLTVSVAKDPMSGDYGFEAGAMVLGNGGLCCIDEFDKMPAEHQALLEAMEQQSVSVAKAGLVANLTARTSVLAAANPVGGHYIPRKTVNENLKMSAALLSRFDLVFILVDNHDEQTDEKLSEHVMALYGGRGGRKKFPRTQNFLADAALQSPIVKQNGPLGERLRIPSPSNFQPIRDVHFRKYIAYARQHCHPRLTEGACVILQAFYLKLREHSRPCDGTPITARQLESLIRLAEARARVELREEVTEQDAQDVVDLMSESLFHKLVDENGQIDVGRSGGMSKSRETKRFMAHLTKLAAKQTRPLYTRTELGEIADGINLNVPNLDDVIDKLNELGFLLQKAGGKFEIQP